MRENALKWCCYLGTIERVESRSAWAERDGSKLIQDLQEISDGKIYGSNDMAKLGCGDCAGCHACCQGMGESIVLDPLDVWRLQKGTGKCFDELLEKHIELHLSEGLILPNIKMAGKEDCCTFLNKEGRCGIYTFRPGLCRTFPLGRLYEKNTVRYFLQKDACEKTNRTKIKINRWLDTGEPKQYEKYLVQWHSLRKILGEYAMQEADETARRTLHLFLLNNFYVNLYEQEADFYETYVQTMDRVKSALPILEEIE